MKILERDGRFYTYKTHAVGYLSRFCHPAVARKHIETIDHIPEVVGGDMRPWTHFLIEMETLLVLAEAIRECDACREGYGL